MNVTELTAADQVAVEALWNFHVVRNPSARGEILVVLGSHDLTVASHAAHLFHIGIAPLIMVTGGSGKITKDQWADSEADRYVHVLKAAGITDEAIIVERDSTNTGDNFAFSRDLTRSMGITPATGVVVCKPYMARRALATGAKQWPEVDWRACPQQIEVWDYPSPDVPLDRMINLMVGDLQRLDTYADRGFQIPVEIPDDVWSAYRHLVRAGFDRFVT